ncbi:MAG: iron ABC transporter permease [Clostridia bacterium]|jgi:iron complex transport system permease protein|nr:iron ABC transporter permease [Clostridia bacterium]MEE1049923.1 iron ABC transporter permease [Clostridia bacterium]
MKSLQKNRIVYTYAISLAVLLLSVILGILLGSTKISLSDMLGAIVRGDYQSTEARILLYVRLPRVLGSLICGMALAVSGAVIQGVLANRLASPSIIGVNAGAGLAVTLCSAFGIIGGWQLSLFSFLGAFFAVMIVSTGAKKWGASRGTVILLGVALNAFLGAVSDTVKTFIPEVSIISNDFRVGDFSSVTYAKVIPAAVAIIVAVIVLQTFASDLDVLTLGDENAKGLGLNTGVMRIVFLMLSALLAGAAVSVCGLLSFVGLLVPHAVRRIATSEAKHLVPLSALFGAGFVTLCDTLARVVFAPYELPVGIIMAFLGAPFFIFILIKGKGGRRNA